MMNHIINEIKNFLEEINSRITESEERKSDQEDKMVLLQSRIKKKE